MTDSQIKSAIAWIILHQEGTETTNDPRDPGGLTKFGITQRTYSGSGGNGSVADLTMDQAVEWYFGNYGNRNPYPRVKNPVVGCKILSHEINMGELPTFKLAQESLGITADGCFGNASMYELNKADPGVFLQRFVDGVLGYYDKLIERKPQLSVFRAGWERRAREIPPASIFVTTPAT